MPHIERLTSFKGSSYNSKVQKWQKSLTGRFSTGSMEIAHGVIELSVRAGQKLAEETPEILLERTNHLENSLSPIVQEILIEVYAHLPEQHADAGIRWLLADLSRLSLGSGFDEPEWMPAVRLIKALSPHCSQDIFRRLEHVLAHYHAPNEMSLAKYRIKGWKQGYFDFYWGQAQYFLLPALSSNRISRSTEDLISVLNRKFEGYAEWRFLRNGRITGRSIGSKLDKNLNRISDRAWMEIIKNKDIPEERRGNWQQVDEDYAVESSITQFSQSLARIAKRFPDRFARLALRFPEDTHPLYVSAILAAMALTKPESDLPEEERPDWEPAPVETVVAVWERFCETNDREVAISFCRLICKRAAETWPDSSIEKLLYLAANHPDLEPGRLNVYCDKSAEESSVEILFQNTINCVRGVAAEAIGELLRHHPDWLDKLRPGIESLVMDPHPAVRMAAIGTLLPIFKIDRKQAISWFCKASEEDTRVSASPHAVHFFGSLPMLPRCHSPGVPDPSEVPGIVCPRFPNCLPSRNNADSLFLQPGRVCKLCSNP